MASRRFLIPAGLICDGDVRLPDAEARHLKNVLRIREGERVEVFDGEGGVWSGAVEFKSGEVFVCGLAQIHTENRPAASRVTLAMSMIKPARFEWALEKATELGVDEFLPLYTARSEIRVTGEKIPGRLARWDRITGESSKQCLRLNVPRVRPPMEFRDFVSAEEYARYDKILFHEKSDNLWMPDGAAAGGDAIICIGPEGGWTEDEICLAEKSGFGVFGLGTSVLRAETAAIAALAVFRLGARTSRPRKAP